MTGVMQLPPSELAQKVALGGSVRRFYPYSRGTRPPESKLRRPDLLAFIWRGTSENFDLDVPGPISAIQELSDAMVGRL
jgi:hypothetical protein